MTRNYRNDEERAATIAGLREVADYLETNPEVPLDRFGEIRLSLRPQGQSDVARVAEVDRIAALLGVPAGPVEHCSAHYRMEREFGPAGARVVYEVTAISSDYMARYRALNSYNDCVQPEEEEHCYEHV